MDTVEIIFGVNVVFVVLCFSCSVVYVQMAFFSILLQTTGKGSSY